MIPFEYGLLVFSAVESLILTVLWHSPQTLLPSKAMKHHQIALDPSMDSKLMISRYSVLFLGSVTTLILSNMWLCRRPNLKLMVGTFCCEILGLFMAVLALYVIQGATVANINFSRFPCLVWLIWIIAKICHCFNLAVYRWILRTNIRLIPWRPFGRGNFEVQGLSQNQGLFRVLTPLTFAMNGDRNSTVRASGGLRWMGDWGTC